MSWAEDNCIDVYCYEEYNSYLEIAKDFSDKHLAKEIKSVIKNIPKDKYYKMKISIISQALKGDKLSDKQRNVLENTYVNLRIE